MVGGDLRWGMGNSSGDRVFPGPAKSFSAGSIFTERGGNFSAGSIFSLGSYNFSAGCRFLLKGGREFPDEGLVTGTKKLPLVGMNVNTRTRTRAHNVYTHLVCLHRAQRSPTDDQGKAGARKRSPVTPLRLHQHRPRHTGFAPKARLPTSTQPTKVHN